MKGSDFPKKSFLSSLLAQNFIVAQSLSGEGQVVRQREREVERHREREAATDNERKWENGRKSELGKIIK